VGESLTQGVNLGKELEAKIATKVH
jgi:hypothetical protein